MADELNKAGCKVSELPEGMEIDGVDEIKPVVFDSHNDHRVAMAFALTGLKIKGVVIDNPMCCKKTFENYFEVFEKAYYD